MKLAFAISLLGLSISGSAQSPTKAEVFPAAQLKDQLSQLAQKANSTGSGGATLGEYGSHRIMLSERTASGGAEVHAHFDDVMIVMGGKATLITGGSLIDAHVGENGETSGSGIRDGNARSIEAGDVIHVPAGTPHQLIIDAGTLYSALVIKVKE